MFSNAEDQTKVGPRSRFQPYVSKVVSISRQKEELKLGAFLFHQSLTTWEHDYMLLFSAANLVLSIGLYCYGVEKT